ETVLSQHDSGEKRGQTHQKKYASHRPGAQAGFEFCFSVMSLWIDSFLAHPLAKTFFQVLERLIQGAVFVFSFPYHPTHVYRSDERREWAIIIMPEFDPADGVYEMGDVWVKSLK
ncbi:hypothetical protein RZS08_27490, partial [Arthrospira platensis SPKY1]|nr:hypothetical protein [Arthrospira platensis SPKY1]